MTTGAGRKRGGGIVLKKHLEAIRVADLRDVHAFWVGGDAPKGTKKELVSALSGLMVEEGVLYRRVRTLTRKVLDVLLLFLRRDGYGSDLPGLFRRMPGEEALQLEYHEAEAGIKALIRRGFLAQVSAGGRAGNGRVVYTVPEELGLMLTSLFREETRTIGSVVSLAQHAASITAAEREKLRGSFPSLPIGATDEDAQLILGEEGAPALIGALPDPLGDVVRYISERHGGVCTRADWSNRNGALTDVHWERETWARALERAAVGTVARISLKNYGIDHDDDLFVVFEEVYADRLARQSVTEPQHDAILQSRCDLVADLGFFLEFVRRNPVRISRAGEVYKAGRRRIQKGFVFHESSLAGPTEIWTEIYKAAEHLALIGKDGEDFLELRPEAEEFLDLPLEQKVHSIYRYLAEQPGPRGRSLHQHELRTVVAELLREHPTRWWHAGALESMARHRYMASLDERGIKDRHRDRFFTAYFSGRETPGDLSMELGAHWLPRLYMLGILDVAMEEDRPRGWRLTPLGARVIGADLPEVGTGLQPLLVNPDFEVLVLPEGDVTDVIHTLDGYAVRVNSGDVVTFRLTKESIEAAVGRGRSVQDLVEFLKARSRGEAPQNVLYSLGSWAGSVTFATLEKGVLLCADTEDALDRILAVPEMSALLNRRLSPEIAFLKRAPADKKLLASLREKGIELQAT